MSDFFDLFTVEVLPGSQYFVSVVTNVIPKYTRINAFGQIIVRGDFRLLQCGVLRLPVMNDLFMAGYVENA